MTSERISRFAGATATAARASRPRSNPADGAAPDSAASSSAQRCTGTAWATIR